VTGGRWQAKTKLAIGDLSSWRLNQEVSDMIAEACRGIEAAESEAQGGVEAGTRSVAAAVPRREAELEKAKLKVRLAKALADKESAEAALREERAGHAQHLSALEALDEQPSTEAAKVAKAARGELSVEAQWQFTIASLSRALALRPTASGIAGESPRQHPETAPKSPPRPGAADGSTPERGAVDLAASALALQAQVTALTVELSKTQRGLEAERRRAGEHERALKQLREEKSATREHARILRLEKEGKELSEQLAFRNAQEVAAQNRIRALTGEVESLKRGLAARSGRDKESAAGREVLQARASLEAAHKDLERCPHPPAAPAFAPLPELPAPRPGRAPDGGRCHGPLVAGRTGSACGCGRLGTGTSRRARPRRRTARRPRLGRRRWGRS